MSNEKFKLIMSYLDIIEAELDKIAIATGHQTLAKWKLGEVTPSLIDNGFTGA